MDLTVSDEQQAIRAAVQGMLDRHGGPAESSRLLDALHAGGYLDLVEHASAIEAALVVELTAATPAPITGRALVAPLVGVGQLPRRVALCESPSGGLVRHGSDADMLLILDEHHDQALVASPDDYDVEAVDSRYEDSLARVRVRNGEALDPGSGERLRAAWSLALAVELAANALEALRITAEYVARRHQFGRPIGSFQAIQHRLATSYVKAEGARWLARRASGTPTDEYLTACAATFACVAAAEAYTATHQASGAMGLTAEHGLVDHSMRLVALQRELGGQRAHARRAARHRKDSPTATPRLIPATTPRDREAALDRST